MAHIDYYFSPLSPYTYLAGTGLEAVAEKHGATVRYKPLDIIALFGRTGGVPVPQRHPSRQAYRAQDLVRQAGKRGLPFNLKPAHWPTNGAPACYAFIAAQKAGGGDLGALAHALARAVWAEDRDIADDGVIRAALQEAGFDPGLADAGLLAGAEEYAANLEDAVNADVFGAPFWVVDGAAHFWGQDRLEDLDLYLSGTV